MIVDANMVRWIKSSVADAIKTIIAPLHLHVDGFEDVTETKEEWVELYINVRAAEQTAQNRYEVDVYLGCLTRKLNTPYELERIHGIALKAITTPICIYKYGPVNSENTQEQIGTLERGRYDGMIFGIVSDRSVRLRRATVEGHFEFFA